MLVAVDLAKFYGMRPVLRGVGLRVAAGEFLAVLGPNGAGKTTLLRILATLARPDAGKLAVGGVDALEHPARARALIGVVSHQTLIYPDLTALENLEFFARMYGIDGGRTTNDGRGKSSIENRQSKIENALRRVDLWPRAHDLARTFSRGMIQRLAIARAVLHDPPLLLLDEPYTGLDQGSARNLSALLRELAIGGRAVVMTTHEFGRGLDGVTRALVLRGGRVAAELADGITAERLAAFFDS
jgi:heme exporter protein A